MEFAVSGGHIELAQLLKASRYVGTGGEAKLAIKNRWATLNGEVCTMCAKKIFPGDVVVFDDKVINVVEKK